MRIYVGGEVVYIHVAQGSGLCSCYDNTKSVQCIRVATTTRQVSAVTNPSFTNFLTELVVIDINVLKLSIKLSVVFS